MEEFIMSGTESRIARLRERVRTATPQMDIERACLMTESYKETEAYPQIIRRAKALANILNKMTINIYDEELIVGNAVSNVRGGIVTPEINWENSVEAIETPYNECDAFAPVPTEFIEKMKEVNAYWHGRALYDKLSVSVPADMLAAHVAVQLPAGSSIANNNMGAHMGVDYGSWLSKGFISLKKEIEEKIAALDLSIPEDTSKREFYTAVDITLQAAIDFSKRHADLARELAAKEANPQRAAELNRIAEICEWVPANPPRDFYEAVQFIWLTYVVLLIEGWGPGMAFGRVDQYLYPYYKKGIDDGTLTRDQARELIGCLNIKTNQAAVRYSFEKLRTAGGLTLFTNITLGGITKDGRDAVNDLSYLFLEAQEEVNMSADEVCIRINSKTPEKFLLRACETAKNLHGKLKFICDETSIEALMNAGKLQEDSRDYIVCGCCLPTVPGVAYDIIGGGFNFPMMLEFALNNGKSRITGEQIGLETGDPRKFKTYEEVWEAYTKQVEYFLGIFTMMRKTDRQLFADYLPTPFQSSGFPRCLENGADITRGGTAPYITDSFSAMGCPNVADALAAMKKLVFEEKKVTIERLIDGLDNDFEGDDELLTLLTKAPKYGNDDDYVDNILFEVFHHFENSLKKYKGPYGSTYTVGAFTAAGHITLGERVGALPDGRRSGAPLSEGGLSPYNGRNVSGSTATINSVTKLDIAKISGGGSLNMKINPSALKDTTNLRRFASLIKVLFDKGGYHVQFNIISSEMLKEAMKCPEKYRDLLVRVATYSAFFTDIGPELQQEIVERSEFEDI